MSDNINRKLWEAALAGDEALVSQLIDQATVDWRGDYDNTALRMAAQYGHAPVVTRLLDAGWSPEARTCRGQTPLIRGANIDTQDNGKRTPLHWASDFG